ncbi:17120_t:CDS:2 [Dentiscutata erythropus]|uniref:17120_t:CDS:1 n=1 Tax=Dentiscutata erythropus TaxID=1348616 RepID=A0A9N8Z4T2_9GLOM|nr:17120_t:CDS:2 [Dentiscutata erythropus]
MLFEFNNAESILISKDDKDTEEEDNEFNILKFRLLVKGKDNEAFPAKVLEIQTILFKDFLNTIQLQEYNQAKANKKNIQVLINSDTEVNYTKKFKQNTNSKSKISNYKADKDKLQMALIISTIHTKQQCDQCQEPCWPTENGHIKLTGNHYSTWARAVTMWNYRQNSDLQNPYFIPFPYIPSSYYFAN